eukprot:gnl/TRDRNA2_/TRDRNA2_195261_c0_seq1.p1 gnl/TRDRNA2_/TRDRNA2_195261_c0~~gnl/TRDRNA2_/TRDRNA2_195261_c0_seq1.p1  ORF type:complete len:503 (-),score=63.73 gnl/TRDRNA2_/TRDRNA2_195261_c0_seq1:170-1678(-)
MMLDASVQSDLSDGSNGAEQSHDDGNVTDLSRFTPDIMALPGGDSLPEIIAAVAGRLAVVDDEATASTIWSEPTAAPCSTADSDDLNTLNDNGSFATFDSNTVCGSVDVVADSANAAPRSVQAVGLADMTGAGDAVVGSANADASVDGGSSVDVGSSMSVLVGTVDTAASGRGLGSSDVGGSMNALAGSVEAASSVDGVSSIRVSGPINALSGSVHGAALADNVGSKDVDTCADFLVQSAEAVASVNGIGSSNLGCSVDAVVATSAYGNTIGCIDLLDVADSMGITSAIDRSCSVGCLGSPDVAAAIATDLSSLNISKTSSHVSTVESSSVGDENLPYMQVRFVHGSKDSVGRKRGLPTSRCLSYPAAEAEAEDEQHDWDSKTRIAVRDLSLFRQPLSDVTQHQLGSSGALKTCLEKQSEFRQPAATFRDDEVTPRSRSRESRHDIYQMTDGRPRFEPIGRFAAASQKHRRTLWPTDEDTPSRCCQTTVLRTGPARYAVFLY